MGTYVWRETMGGNTGVKGTESRTREVRKENLQSSGNWKKMRKLKLQYTGDCTIFFNRKGIKR